MIIIIIIIIIIITIIIITIISNSFIHEVIMNGLVNKTRAKDTKSLRCNVLNNLLKKAFKAIC